MKEWFADKELRKMLVPAALESMKLTGLLMALLVMLQIVSAQAQGLWARLF